MRRVIHKLFYIWELDKEECWINEMAAHGYGLTRAGRFSFEFDEVEPNKYIYKTLFLSGTGYSKKNTDFYRFLEEMGITMVNRINYPGTCCVYTRALKEDYPNGIELYSDIDSKINYDKVIMWYLFFCFFASITGAIPNIYMALEPTNGVRIFNFMTAGLMVAFAAIAIVSFFKRLINIRKLKKERKIHE